MGFSICFISCQRDDTFQGTQTESQLDLKSVNTKDVAKAYRSYKRYAKSDQSWLTPYFEYNDSISIINSNAKITVTPAITEIPNAYSRLFSLNIDGEVKTVVYHMFPNDQSTSDSFYGGVMITELNGDVLSAFKVEDNLYTSYYDVASSNQDLNILDFHSRSNNCDDDPDCFDDGELDEVIVVAPGNGGLSLDIIIIFLPEFTDSNDGGGAFQGPSTPTEPSAPAGDTNENACPPGKVKDENGCVCAGADYVEDENGNCVKEECPDGYVRNDKGDCVKDPCAEIGDLITNQKYKDKLDELKGVTDQVNETGYGYHTSDNFNLMGLANDGKSVSIKHFNLNFYTGFVHTHTCVTENPNETNISMPSPADIKALKTLIGFANINGRNIHDAFVTVVNCNGIFDLRYTGTFDAINTHNYSDSTYDTYESYFEEFKGNDLLAFKKYLKNVVQLEGLELYQYVEDETTDDYDVNHIDFNQNEDDVEPENDCN